MIFSCHLSMVSPQTSFEHFCWISWPPLLQQTMDWNTICENICPKPPFMDTASFTPSPNWPFPFLAAQYFWLNNHPSNSLKASDNAIPFWDKRPARKLKKQFFDLIFVFLVNRIRRKVKLKGSSISFHLFLRQSGDCIFPPSPPSNLFFFNF